MKYAFILAELMMYPLSVVMSRMLWVIEEGFARIGNRARRRVGQSQVLIQRRQQHHAAVAGHVAAIEAALNHAPSKVPKFESR